MPPALRKSTRNANVTTTQATNTNNLAKQERQSWREKPKEITECQLGQTVTLNCKVNHSVLFVTWYKRILNGTKLDLIQHMDRDAIPDYPRYKYVGNVKLGENDLQLQNVQFSDAGDYECEARAAIETETLRAPARLIVHPPQPNATIASAAAVAASSATAVLLRQPSAARVNYTTNQSSSTSFSNALYCFLFVLASFLVVVNVYLLVSLNKRRKAAAKQNKQRQMLQQQHNHNKLNNNNQKQHLNLNINHHNNSRFQ